MEEYVMPSTSTFKHPQLEELNVAVARILAVFDEVPRKLQLIGLDIIQGVVSLIMHKITHDRITAVDFVPFEKTDSPEIKQEPPDVDSEHVSLIASTSLTSADQLEALKDELQPSPLLPYTRRNTCPHRETSQSKKPTTRVAAKKQARKAKQMAAKPIGIIQQVHLKDLQPQEDILAIEHALKQAKTGGVKSTSQSDTARKTTRKKGGKKSQAKDKTLAAKKIELNFKLSNEPAAKKVALTPSKEATRLTTDDVDEPVTMSEELVADRLNGPVVIRAVTDFKTTEEIRAMFPDEIINPKRRNVHWSDKTDLSKEQLVCQQCPYYTDTAENMAVHLQAHDGDLSCPHCNKTFTAAGSLKRHLMIHRGDRQFSCPICNKAFYTSGDLRQHAVSHTGERPHACALCGKAYTLSANLRRHMRVHTGERPYRCSVCPDITFRDYTSLKFHELKHTGEKPYACEECGKQFRTSSDIIRHRRVHSVVCSYTCHVCGRGFKQRASVTAHLRVHTDVYLHNCELCAKRFRTKSSLQHHKRWHAGVKPYTCDTCGKAFTTKTYLAVHVVLHGSSKPSRFQCKTCRKYFDHRSNLVRHERIHSSERKYKCRFCPKAFKYINALSYHEGIHTGVKVMCDKCGASFRTTAALKNHMCQCVDIKEEAVGNSSLTPLEKITQGTSQSLSPVKKTASATSLTGLKLRVKLSPMFRKVKVPSPKRRKAKDEKLGELGKTLHLKQACVRLEKLETMTVVKSTDLKKNSEVRATNSGRKLSRPGVHLNNGPMAAKIIKIVAPEKVETETKDTMLDDSTGELITQSPETVKAVSVPKSQSIEVTQSRNNLVKSPAAKMPVRKRKSKRRCTLSRKKSHKNAFAQAVVAAAQKATAQATAAALPPQATTTEAAQATEVFWIKQEASDHDDDDREEEEEEEDSTKVVSGDMELSVDATQERETAAQLEGWDLDRDLEGAMDLYINAEASSKDGDGAESPYIQDAQLNEHAYMKCTKDVDGEDFIVSLNKDFYDEVGSQKASSGEEEDTEEEQLSAKQELANGNRIVLNENFESESVVCGVDNDLTVSNNSMKNLEFPCCELEREHVTGNIMTTNSNGNTDESTAQRGIESQTKHRQLEENGMTGDLPHQEDVMSQALPGGMLPQVNVTCDGNVEERATNCETIQLGLPPAMPAPPPKPEEIDVISEMENVVNDFLLEAQQRKEQEQSSSETNTDLDMMTTSANYGTNVDFENEETQDKISASDVNREGTNADNGTKICAAKMSCT